MQAQLANAIFPLHSLIKKKSRIKPAFEAFLLTLYNEHTAAECPVTRILVSIIAFVLKENLLATYHIHYFWNIFRVSQVGAKQSAVRSSLYLMLQRRNNHSNSNMNRGIIISRNSVYFNILDTQKLKRQYYMLYSNGILQEAGENHPNRHTAAKCYVVAGLIRLSIAK